MLRPTALFVMEDVLLVLLMPLPLMHYCNILSYMLHIYICVEDVMEMDEMLYVTYVLLPFTTNQKVPGDMPFIVLL